MKLKVIIQTLVVAICCAALSPGQEAKQPRPKSQKELEAIQAVFGAQDPDGRIKAGNELLTKFADTEFKAIVLQVIAMSYQQKNDSENMIVFAERTIEADPKNYSAMLMIAGALAQRTREFDLDKEEKLGRAEKLANDALALIKDAPKPRPDIADDQWEAAKKDANAEAYASLGMASSARKKFDDAIKYYKLAIETAAQPDAVTLVRLGATYNLAGKYDDAVAILDKVMADPQAMPQIKQFAQAERARAIQAKGGGAKPAAPAAAPAATGASPAAPAAPPAPAAPKP
jgi:tetratricopeptide (TPR) repeat protein